MGKGGWDRLLPRLALGSTVSGLAAENHVTHVAIVRWMHRHCPAEYRAALIAGMRVQLAQHAAAGNTRRYRSLLAVAAARYPQEFEFQYRNGWRPGDGTKEPGSRRAAFQFKQESKAVSKGMPALAEVIAALRQEDNDDQD